MSGFCFGRPRILIGLLCLFFYCSALSPRSAVTQKIYTRRTDELSPLDDLDLSGMILCGIAHATYRVAAVRSPWSRNYAISMI